MIKTMKKIIRIGVIAIMAACMCSCEDVYDVDVPTLDISFANTDKVDLDGVLHVYIGDVVTINISGDMDILYQYSGVPGSQYFLDDEVCTWGGTAMLQVATELESDYGSRQKNNLRMCLSTDYTGIKDSMNIVNANWIEVPYEDVGYSEEEGDYVYSNWLNLFDYIDEDSDYVYVAYNYTSVLPSEASGLYGATWRVRDFDLRRTYADGRYQYYGLYDADVTANDMTGYFCYAGFVDYVEWICEGSMTDTITDSTKNHWVIATANALLTPATSAATLGDYIANDDWLVSHEFDLKRAPANDPSVSLKGTTEDVPTSTSLYYDQAGLFQISIVAKNLTIGDEETIVKRLWVNVTDASATE